MIRTSEQADIVIVGGGAAGLAAAVVAGETLRGSGAARVVLCEAADRIGRSVLATGNGRCNFSNARLTEAALCDAEMLEPFYRNAAFVARAFAALEELSPFKKDVSDPASFPVSRSNAVLRFFADHGLVWREEGEGRLYPLANKASSVLDVLRAAIESAQVHVQTEVVVRSIVKRAEGGYLLKGADGRELRAQRVVLAVGGSVCEDMIASFELPFTPQRPVLGPLAVDAKGKRVTKRLDNIRVKAAAVLVRDGSALRREHGEVLFRAYGLSGIAVFDLSRDAERGDEVSLDLLPQLSFEETIPFFADRAARLRSRCVTAASFGDVLRGVVLPQVADALCENVRVKAQDAYHEEGGRRLARALHDLRFTVEGIGDIRQCQVRRGGIPVVACDHATLEATAVPGLHVAGEALDVDAACGGFNLHWAWASGMLAGHHVARGALRDAEEGR